MLAVILLLISVIIFHSSAQQIQQKINIELKLSKHVIFQSSAPTALNADLSGIQWDDILINEANGVNKMFSSFYNKFNKIVNKHTPLRKRQIAELKNSPNRG